METINSLNDAFICRKEEKGRYPEVIIVNPKTMDKLTEEYLEMVKFPSILNPDLFNKFTAKKIKFRGVLIRRSEDIDEGLFEIY